MQPLTLNVKLLKAMYLWPDESQYASRKIFLIKHSLFICTLAPSAITSVLGAARQLNHLEDIAILIDQIIGLCALSACIYMCECLVNSVQHVRNLTKQIASFGDEFGAKNILKETEEKIQMYTKGILLYGIVGNICYALFPLVTKSSCKEIRKSSQYIEDHDPCGLIIRCWYPFKVSEFPLFYLAYFIQMYTCITVSTLVLTITMLLVGLLMYAQALLKDCGNYVKNSCDATTKKEMEDNVTFCVKYHIAIILYSSNINEAFSSMMLCHMTLTSFQISILGFEVIMVDNITDSLRFSMHLFGWVVLLFFICFYGQNLIDESAELGIHAYSSAWYIAPVKVQKDLQLMILRSQKPLTLSAASLGVMSLETFLGVISTAYSYFTLLLNIKDDSK